MDLFAGQVVLAVRHDKRHRLFAIDRAGGRDHGNFPYSPIGREDVFQLQRVNFLSAAIDHVLAAIFDVQPAFVVEIAQIAGTKPALRIAARASLTVLPVLVDHHIAF